jgi:transposase
MSELSEEFGITRKTGHKWLLRYAGGGMKGLEERSRAPKKVSNRTSEEVERLIVSEKREHMTGGQRRSRPSHRGQELIFDILTY